MYLFTEIYRHFNYHQEALNYGRQTLALANELRDSLILGKVLWSIANVHLKLYPRGGKVSVNSSLLSERMRLIVSDTGIGMTKEYSKKILDDLSFARRRETQGEISTGLGLMLVKDLVKQNNSTEPIHLQ